MTRLQSLRIISHDVSLRNRLQSFAENVMLSIDALPSLPPNGYEVTFLDPDGYEPEVKVAMLEEIRSAGGDPVIIFSDSTDRELVLSFFCAGASGYLLKNDSDAMIGESLKNLKDGFTPLSSVIARHMVEAALGGPTTNGDSELPLKPREVELLQLLSEGFTKREIGEKKALSIHTVDNHVRKVYEKLGAKNLGQAVGIAFRQGIIS